MMQNLWRVQTEKKIHTPHDIISEQCKYLSEMTDGKVIARIAPYKGDYKSYSKSNELELAGRLFVQDNSFDVQNVLGDQQSKFIYEFYITAKAAPNINTGLCLSLLAYRYILWKYHWKSP